MSVRNIKARQKKNLKKEDSPPLSASPMSVHFIERCLGRKGVLKPVHKKAIKRMIKKGKVRVEDGEKGRKILTFPDSGEKFVVSGKKMKGITFMN